MDETLQMLKDLTDAPGVPGQEDPVREVMARYLAPHGELMYDNPGSIVGMNRGKNVDDDARRILVAGNIHSATSMTSTTPTAS